MALDLPEDRSIYIYYPNKIAPAFFATAFTLSGALHFWQCYRYKCFKLTFLHIVCCLMFAVGFALRECNAFNYTFTKANLDIYIASTSLIYMSPPLLELANYHVLGRILYYVPYCSPLHPGRVLTTFGLLSAIVEVLNAIGVAYIANPSVPEKITKLGHALMKTSLILQLVVIACFCALAWMFQRRCKRAGIGSGRKGSNRVSAPLVTLYASMFVIFVRCVYRTVEHFGFSDMGGMNGKWIVSDVSTLSPLVRHEWFFYVFEAGLMVVNSVLWNVRHPHRYLPERYETYLTRDGVTELVGPGWRDERPFIVTVLDPFGWLVRKGGEGKEEGKPFWETDGYGLEGQHVHVHGDGHGFVPGEAHGIPLLADPGAGAATAV